MFVERSSKCDAGKHYHGEAPWLCSRAAVKPRQDIGGVVLAIDQYADMRGDLEKGMEEGNGAMEKKDHRQVGC